MKKKLNKLVLIQTAAALLAAPITLYSPQLLAAETNEQTVVEDENGKMAVETIEMPQADTINWTISVEKAASTTPRQVKLAFSLPEGLTDSYEVVDLKNSLQPLVKEKNGSYLVGEKSTDKQTYQLQVKTKIHEEKEKYQLQISPLLLEEESEVRLGKQQSYTFMYTPETTSDSELTDETTASTINTNEENDSSTSSENVDSTMKVTETNASDKASETTITSTNEENTNSTIVSGKTVEDKTTKQSRAGMTGASKIPSGAIVVGNSFAPTKNAGGTGKFVINEVNDTAANNGKPYSEVSMTGTDGRTSIWANNKLDFTKNFSGSTYLNFGTAEAEGFAFVMQNDSGKTEALTTAAQQSDAQNIGVYGGTRAYGYSVFPTNHSIQNSVAIEMDTKMNVEGNDSVGLATDSKNYDLDLALKVPKQDGPHMAYTFPADPVDGFYPVPYENLTNDWFNTAVDNGYGRAAVQHHYGTQMLNNSVISDNIQDGTWYEFQFSFNKAHNTFSYALVNPTDNTKKLSATIPMDQLSSHLKLSENDNQAYWGFTASSGSTEGETKLAFGKLPTPLSSEIKNDVLNDTDNSLVIKDDSVATDPHLKNDSFGTFESVFTVKDTNETLTFSNWLSELDSTYFDLSTIKEVKGIVLKESGETTNFSAKASVVGNEISVKPDETISLSQGDKLSFSYQVKSRTAKNNTDFASRSKTTFNSQMTLIDDSGEYTEPSNPVTFLVGDAIPKVDATASEYNYTDYIDQFSLSLTYSDVDAADDELVAELYLLNDSDKPYETVKLNKSSGTYQFKELPIDLLADNTPFKLGTNFWKVIVRDADEEEGSGDDFVVISGYKGFESVTDDYEWSYSRAQLPSIATAQNRTAAMEVKARDTTVAKSQSKIRVSATSVDSTNATVSADDFVFKENGQELALDQVQLPVNQTNNFTTSEGLLLKVSNQDSAGTYEGTVTWSIVDAP